MITSKHILSLKFHFILFFESWRHKITDENANENAVI